MIPFRPKGLINPSLNTRVLGGLKGINCLPSGHPNLNGSHPGLLKDFPRGILVIEMLSASLRPKEVEDEVTKDVKRLFDVGEASYMVPLDPGGVIFSFEDGFTQHDEWPRKSDVIGRSQFLRDVIEGLPSPFGEGTFEEIMLRDLGASSVQTLHVGRIPMHCSQVPIGRPRFKVNHMKVPTFRGWGVMPNFGHNLHDGGVLQV